MNYSDFVDWMFEGYVRTRNVAGLREIEAGNYAEGGMTSDDETIALGVSRWNSWAGRLADEIESGEVRTP